MKKILIFSLAYFPHIGGAEVAVKEITDRISSQEISFDMITLRFDRMDGKLAKIGNVNIWRVGSGIKFLLPISKLLFPFTAFFKAVSLNRKNNYDAVWSIMANRAGFAALFFKLFHPKIKFILNLQEGDTLDYPLRRMGILKLILNPFFKRIFTKADIIQAISNYLADWARNMGAKGQVVVVPNGVNVEGFRVKGLGFREETRNKLGFGKEDTVLITTSRLVEKNAVSDIIDSLGFLPASVKLLVVGVGPLEKTLKFKTLELGLQERIIFLGFASQDEIPKYLFTSDIFVRPSLSEGMGVSFIEAMAAGLPIIATPVGGIPDFLKDGQTGLFCEVKNPKSVAQKVEKLIRDKESRDYIVENASKMVVEKYDWKIIVEEMKSKVFSFENLNIENSMKIVN